MQGTLFGIRPRTRLTTLFSAMVVLIVATTAHAAPVELYRQDFESGLAGWSIDNGVWQLGTATTGPVGSGTIAGTNLEGNYPYQAYSHLFSPWITLPATPQDGALWLRFRYWFSMHTTQGYDYGRVVIRVQPATAWSSLSGQFTSASPCWSQYVADLSAYAGQTVQVGFLIDDLDDNYPGNYESLGLYVDDVCLIEGAFHERDLHTFDDVLLADWTEDDWEGWYAENGVWQIGEPVSGCTEAHSGARCAGTRLDATYAYRNDSRLVSPPVQLPASPRDGQLWLTFWSWSALHWNGGADYARLEIRVGTGSWQPLHGTWYHWSGCWSPVVVDLADHLGETVRFGFRLIDLDDNYPGTYESHGWFVDDVAIREGRRWLNNTEGFEGTITGWSSQHGLWQMGAPTSGPGSGHESANCWGTNLSGNYGLYSISSLTSTTIDLPSDPPVFFKYWNWFSFASNQGDDYGSVIVHHATGDSVMVESVTGSSGGWIETGLDLSAFAGQSIRISFRTRDFDNNYPGHYEAAGWYLDDFEFVGLPTSTPPAPEHLNVSYSHGASVIECGTFEPTATKLCLYATRDLDEKVSLGNRIALLDPPLATFEDVARPGFHYYYRLTTIDDLGHESAVHAWSTGMGDDPPTLRVPIATLHEPVPNPFNPTVEIRFTLREREDVRLTVYDLAGRRVATLVDGRLGPGLHAIPFRPDDLASGVYLARLKAASEVHSTKLTLLK